MEEAKIRMERNTRSILHHRSLELKWADGTHGEIHLDHGLGFLSARPCPRHAFGASPGEQVRTILAYEFVVSNRTAFTPVFVSSPK